MCVLAAEDFLMKRFVVVLPLGHPEGEYRSGENPCGECHQTEEPVRELPEDERSGGCSSSKSPNCSYDEPGTLITGVTAGCRCLLSCWVPSQ